MHTRYRLTGRLETGELAELFSAVRDDREKVLIKLFHPRNSDRRYARIIADAQLKLAELPDAAILRVLDMGTVQGRLAIVREYVDGYTLGQALQRLMTREVLLPPHVALFVVIQLLDAVQRTHELGMVHGAITPGNIILGRDGRTAVGDFGALAALQSVPELRSFAARGRSAYRAPEVITQGEAYPTSDVYSLGAIAYELLTLKEAVRASKTVSTRHQPLPPPSRLDRRINGRLDPIIMRAIEQAPQRRFRSCAEMSTALRNFLAASGGMPSKADLARVVGELFPNEVQLQVNPQVPFAASFSLEEVTGVDVSSLADRPDLQPEVLMARPSFSGGAIPAVMDEALAGAETMEGMPAFADYAEIDGPRSDEGTSPGGAGPLERGWDAPPGQAPIKKPLGAGMTPMTGRSAALKRFRVMEDLSAPSVEVDASLPATRELARPKKQKEPEPPPDPGAEISQPLSSETSTHYPLVKEPDGKKRRMITEEKILYKASVKQNRFLAVAIGVALVGMFSFGLVIYRYGAAGNAAKGAAKRTSGAEDRAVRRAPNPVAVNERAAPPAPAAARPAPVQEPVRIEAEAPKEELYRAPRRRTAFLTVKANEQAKVYIDGRRVPGLTPFRRLKVEPGTRKIRVQSVRTGEEREVSRRFVRGKTQLIQEYFRKPGR